MTPGISGAIDHVHIYVPSRRDAARWYQKTLGFEVVEKYAFWATPDGGPLTISDVGQRAHLALFRSQDKRPASLAFGATAVEYAAWREHLQALNLELREDDYGLSRSLHFSDPFGNMFEITTYEVDETTSP